MKLENVSQAPLDHQEWLAGQVENLQNDWEQQCETIVREVCEAFGVEYCRGAGGFCFYLDGEPLRSGVWPHGQETPDGWPGVYKGFTLWAHQLSPFNLPNYKYTDDYNPEG